MSTAFNEDRQQFFVENVRTGSLGGAVRAIVGGTPASMAGTTEEVRLLLCCVCARSSTLTRTIFAIKTTSIYWLLLSSTQDAVRHAAQRSGARFARTARSRVASRRCDCASADGRR